MKYDPEMMVNSKRTPKLPEFNRSTAQWVAIVVLAIILLSTTFYSVATDEVGVVKRMGAYTRTVQSGLHLKLPFAIEKVQKVRVKYVFKEEFGFATERPGVRTVYRRGDFSAESLMLTGDLNAAVVEWIVQYQDQRPGPVSVQGAGRSRNAQRHRRGFDAPDRRRPQCDRGADGRPSRGRGRGRSWSCRRSWTSTRPGYR